MVEAKTVVVNLMGGPGCGKSTTAALLYARMKLLGMNVELVREYVKTWAWENRPISQWDQMYFLGKQSIYESKLYGKVDYIITDSPILLAGMYQEVQSEGKNTYTSQAAREFINHAKEEGVSYENFFLKRIKPYDSRGRWGTEEDAVNMDNFIFSYLTKYEGKEPRIISGPDYSRDYEILMHLKLL